MTLLTIRTRTLAILGALVLASTTLFASVFLSTPSANAVYGNVLRNSVERCTLYVPEGWGATSYMSICGAGRQAGSVGAVRIPKGQCLELGFWSFTRYCAPASNYRLIYIGSGTTFVR